MDTSGKSHFVSLSFSLHVWNLHPSHLHISTSRSIASPSSNLSLCQHFEWIQRLLGIPLVSMTFVQKNNLSYSSFSCTRQHRRGPVCADSLCLTAAIFLPCYIILNVHVVSLCLRWHSWPFLNNSQDLQEHLRQETGTSPYRGIYARVPFEHGPPVGRNDCIHTYTYICIFYTQTYVI